MNVNTAAVVVGVDKYARQPLTSAVNDAVAFRDALVSLGLVEPAAVTLLTSPAICAGREATRDNIGRALRHFYETGADLKRLYVYLAGHGLQAPAGAARGKSCTVFLPADVEDPASQAHLLLNVDDLRGRLRDAGPVEQLFFVDACRDLVFGDYPPDIPSLGWPASPYLTAARAQGTLFAVSPRGEAVAVRDGLGVMTTHLIDALHNKGLALDYSDDLGKYVVTMQSVSNHVTEKVQETVSGQPLWQQQYRLPELQLSGPSLSFIRDVPEPPLATLTVTIEPEWAACYTKVVLAQRRHELCAPCWPPERSRVPVRLQPQRYEIRATAEQGLTSVDPGVIDVRVRSDVRVDVGGFALGGDGLARLPRSRPGAAQIVELPAVRWKCEAGYVEHGESVSPNVAESARVSATAQEPHASIELRALQPPYRRWQAGPELRQTVSPGYYRIRFRLGAEVFSQEEFELGPGSNVEVIPAAAASSLVVEILGEHPIPRHVVISDSMGPVQSGLPPTLLAVLGLVPFDTTGELSGPFVRVSCPPADAGAFGQRPLSVVVAVDGDGWTAPVEEIVGGIECETVDPVGGRSQVGLSALAPGGRGLGRVARGIVSAPSHVFSVELRSRFFGRIELAAASLPDRVTVVTATLRPDGDFHVGNNLFRLPGAVYDEPVPAVSYGRLLRELQVGQLLYAGAELVERGDVPEAAVIRDLLHARWTDPVLGCMAYYAWIDTEPELTQAARGRVLSYRVAAASNLLQYFAELPDARVIGARQLPQRRSELLSGLLERDEIPILARSVRELARMAREAGAVGAAVVARERRLPPASVWTLSVGLDTGGRQ